MSRSAMSRPVSTWRLQRDEPPVADVPGRDRDRAPRVAFVDVDDQDMAGVGLDVVEVGDFR